MIGRLTLAVAWLAATAMAAPGAPIAEQPSSQAVDPPVQQPSAQEPPTGPADSAPSGEPDPPVTSEAPAPGGAESDRVAADRPPSDASVPPSAAAAPSAAAEAPASEPVPPATATPQSRPGDPDRPTAFTAASGSVSIRDFSFGPSAITVGEGETVTWRNDGPSSHTATATDGSFDTGLLSKGESDTVTFDEAGTFSYLCEPHPNMKGTVRVVAQAAGDDSGSDSPDGDASDGSGAAQGDGTDGGSSGDELPSTGAEPIWLAVSGLGLLLIGASGMRLRRSP